MRVLVDDLGSRYDWPSILGPLREAGVPASTFLPTLAPGTVPQRTFGITGSSWWLTGRSVSPGE